MARAAVRGRHRPCPTSSQEKLHADILDAARLEFAEAKRIAAQVAAEDPELAAKVAQYVEQVPDNIRAALRRPEDMSGTTLPDGCAVEDADDLVKLLPAQLPRFKTGDAPEFLNGWYLEHRLGTGGFGGVWKARNAEDHSLIGAVEFGHTLNDAEQALLNEGDVLTRLRSAGGHPGVVELHDRRTRGVAVPWLRYELDAQGMAGGPAEFAGGDTRAATPTASPLPPTFTNIYVGNLSWQITTDDLYNLSAMYGTIQQAQSCSTARPAGLVGSDSSRCRTPKREWLSSIRTARRSMAGR